MEPCLEGYKRTYRDVSRLDIEKLLREGEKEEEPSPCSFEEEAGSDCGDVVAWVYGVARSGEAEGSDDAGPSFQPPFHHDAFVTSDRFRAPFRSVDSPMEPQTMSAVLRCSVHTKGSNSIA